MTKKFVSSFCCLLALAGCQHRPEAFATSKHSFVSNGVPIQFYTAGEGIPIVLIHGWLSDASFWGVNSNGGPELDPPKGYQLIALDCRGHGQSGKPHDKESYGPEMAEDIIRLMDHLKIKNAHLFGYSMGAFIAGKAAAMHPSRFRSVVFGGQAPILSSRKVKNFAMADSLAASINSPNGLADYIISLTPPGAKPPTLAEAKQAADFMFYKKDAKALAAVGLSFGKLEVTETELQKYTGPVLFIHGGDESLDAKVAVTKARELLPDSDYKVINGTDHMTVLTNKEFGDTILKFIQSHSK